MGIEFSSVLMESNWIEVDISYGFVAQSLQSQPIMAILQGKLGGNFQGPETGDAPVTDKKFQLIPSNIYSY